MTDITPSGGKGAAQGATANSTKEIPLILKIYGFLCMADGIVTVPMIFIFGAMVMWALQTNPELIAVGTDPTLPVVLLAISIVVTLGNGIALIIFGHSLLKDRRRNAARWSYALIATTLVQILLRIMLEGIGTNLIPDAIQLVILLTLSVTVDPTLRHERHLERTARDLTDRQAARMGMLGRDLEGKGYIELNFFNLFWVFVVCCVLGLIIETIYHMVVVEPGVYQDRAGMLFGPFSPIYGFGAVLMTVALNRFYKASPVIIFVVSAIIGGLFEAAVSWFMQTGFGAVAWDYSGSTIFGLFPDPVATLFGGRTSTLFMCMWGALGFVWIKLCLPWLLKLINIIPWKLRYSFTALCTVLMLVNGVMTLQALDCWFERLSGVAGTTPVEAFYAEHFDDAYMAHRFESMTITPEDSGRIDSTAATA
ncbi:putative ABC transporter permease [Collinsella tanakaei]|uniref:putative ABC transporter permease n=1 Tax=Collinsella tanakaei TaxID=626935 RepID=UPI001F240266|nr:putative ABC transporter permease [Collinsella tanakaei]MCF2621383.1 putative ABC transporter permease [Collinsella tanakaei]